MGVAEIEVTASGSSVRVRVGDEILLRVPEIPTTGYAWTVSAVDPALHLVESTYRGESGEPTPGAGGQRVIRLRAASPGEADARFTLKRPWESDAAQTFSLH